MSKRMLADVLWEAANTHLWDGAERPQVGSRHSCDAVSRAAGGRHVLPFLAKLGCPVNGLNAAEQFGLRSESTQGVRYMWLLLAMHVAEDEGITV